MENEKEAKAKVEASPILGYVSSGSQSHVFGTSRWVVVVRRRSVFRMLSLFVSTRRWLDDVREKLHGIVAPFAVVDRYRFRGRLPGGELREFRGYDAIVKPRFAAAQFLDDRIDRGTPEQLYQYVSEVLQLLEKLHARGFHMFDFIRRNFVFVGERLYISDPGLIVPLRYLREPTMYFAALGFGRGLGRDYLDVLASARERTESEELKRRIGELEERLPGRIRALRKGGKNVNEEDWMSVEFPEGLRQDLLRTLRWDSGTTPVRWRRRR